ncbi:uncharacterized protein LOC101857577 isoform X2 [Aplysia californica]|uniref:Uncharacterized protein LOC101857577 isoform X2 n=1 Tax=Aplysia californica TaxID=6500 RepID=A0ABM0JSE6_APLCA|nr:uncharacterized protein LOC101857577 isoform X2 [Aplysia californica]
MYLHTHYIRSMLLCVVISVSLSLPISSSVSANVRAWSPANTQHVSPDKKSLWLGDMKLVHPTTIKNLNFRRQYKGYDTKCHVRFKQCTIDLRNLVGLFPCLFEILKNSPVFKSNIAMITVDQISAALPPVCFHSVIFYNLCLCRTRGEVLPTSVLNSLCKNREFIPTKFHSKEVSRQFSKSSPNVVQMKSPASFDKFVSLRTRGIEDCLKSGFIKPKKISRCLSFFQKALHASYFPKRKNLFQQYVRMLQILCSVAEKCRQSLPYSGVDTPAQSLHGQSPENSDDGQSPSSYHGVSTPSSAIDDHSTQNSGDGSTMTHLANRRHIRRKRSKSHDHDGTDKGQSDVDSSGKSTANSSEQLLFSNYTWDSEFNKANFKKIMEHREFQRQLQKDAQWAYLCLVFLICLMLLSIWCLRGFHNRNTNKREFTLHDTYHLLTVKEVLWRKARYLPMIHREDNLEEVFVHDCGNDP